MSDFDLVLKGDIVLPDRVVERGYVAVRGGKVADLGGGPAPGAEAVEDFTGGLILPGAIDGQVHSRSQVDQEDFLWSTRSAAAGGVTTIVDMPYDDGQLICTAERLQAKAAAAASQARVDFALYGTVHPEDGPRHIAAMVEAGAAAFKFSTFGTHPERFPRIPPHTMYDCFAEIARFDLMAGVHNENEEVIRAALAKTSAGGRTDYLAHGLSRPAISELLAMAEVYELGAATGCAAHVVHCSLGRGYEMARAYRDQGYRATVEACIHYLTLSEEDDVSRLGGIGKINPPIRGRAEREALWRHLAAGNIAIVSTDHVSWSLERKTRNDMLENASGAPGLEALVPLLATGLAERGLAMTWAARLLAENPARLFRIDRRKGALEEGRDADIAVLVPDEHAYDPAASGNNIVDWSPYAGRRLAYRVEAAYLRGRPVWTHGGSVAEPGTGNWIGPGPARSSA